MNTGHGGTSAGVAHVVVHVCTLRCWGAQQAVGFEAGRGTASLASVPSLQLGTALAQPQPRAQVTHTLFAT